MPIIVSRSGITQMGHEVAQRLGLHKPISAAQGCRRVRKTDMVHNSYTPTMEVDAQTYTVRADGHLLRLISKPRRAIETVAAAEPARWSDVLMLLREARTSLDDGLADSAPRIAEAEE